MAAVTSSAILVLLAVTCLVATVECCVPSQPGCQPISTTPSVVSFFRDINSPLVIIAIVVGCIAAIVIILLLIWLCCWCWYRTTDETDAIPSVIRRTIVVKQKPQPAPCPQQQQQQQQQPQQHIDQIIIKKPPPMSYLDVDIRPPPPPVIMHQPSEKIVVVQPVPAKPTSMLLTVSEGHGGASNGTMMTACIEQPLKFTLTPEYVGQHGATGHSIYEQVLPASCTCSGQHQLASSMCTCSHR